MFLLILGSAHAQQTTASVPAPTPAAISADQYVYTPVSNPILTAADSARERARLENARQLRKQATTPPPLLPTTVPSGPRYAAPGESLDPAELTERAKIRRDQEQEMVNKVFKKHPKRAPIIVPSKPATPPSSTGAKPGKSKQSTRVSKAQE